MVQWHEPGDYRPCLRPGVCCAELGESKVGTATSPAAASAEAAQPGGVAAISIHVETAVRWDLRRLESAMRDLHHCGKHESNRT